LEGAPTVWFLANLNAATVAHVQEVQEVHTLLLFCKMCTRELSWLDLYYVKMVSNIGPTCDLADLKLFLFGAWLHASQHSCG
jgi:hypothetical protein